MILGASISIMTVRSGDLRDMLCGFPAGLLFLAGGVWLLINYVRPIAFDKVQNQFWIGFRPPEIPNNKTSCSFNDIYALQLLNSPGYYELNIVLKTGERVHVISHDEMEQMRLDGQFLGEYLGVPVWDTA